MHIFIFFCNVYFLPNIGLLLSDFQGGDASVNSVHLFPKNADHIVVCNKTSSIYIMTLQGQVLELCEDLLAVAIILKSMSVAIHLAAELLLLHEIAPSFHYHYIIFFFFGSFKFDLT